MPGGTVNPLPVPNVYPEVLPPTKTTSAKQPAVPRPARQALQTPAPASTTTIRSNADSESQKAARDPTFTEYS
eukprot:scaffold3494_cov159-Ochromonas_danica.AAC.1